MASINETFIRERAELDQRMAILVDHFSRVGCDALDKLIIGCGQVRTRKDLQSWIYACEGECCSSLADSITSLAQIAAREIRAKVMERQLDALRSEQL